jgi:hypothetical protein
LNHNRLLIIKNQTELDALRDMLKWYKVTQFNQPPYTTLHERVCRLKSFNNPLDTLENIEVIPNE